MNAEKWGELETFLLARRDLAPTTTRKTLRHLRLLERGGLDIMRPNRDHYDAFMALRKKEGRSGPGCKHYARAVRHLLAWRGLHWLDFREPRAHCSPRELLPDDVVARLLNFDEGREDLETLAARFSFRLGFYCALRPSEHYSLELADFDATTRTLRIWSDKLDQYDTLTLEPWLADEIEAYIVGLRAHVARRDTKSLIVDPWTGRPFTSLPAYGMWLGRCGRRVYARFAPGALRHAGLTYYYLQTGDIYLTKARARHQKLSSTEHYVLLGRQMLARRQHAAQVQPYTPGALS